MTRPKRRMPAVSQGAAAASGCGRLDTKLTLHALTGRAQAQAALAVCSHARDVDDARLLLATLGVDPAAARRQLMEGRA